MSLSVATTNSSSKQNYVPKIGAALTTVMMLATVSTNGVAFPIHRQSDNIISFSTYKNQSIQNLASVYNTTINLTGSFDMHYIEIIEKIKSFLNLDNDWNGYGAQVFSDQLVQKAIEIVKSFSVLPEVYPISDGRIQFEFEKANGEYLEFEISESQAVNVFTITADGFEQEYQIDSDADRLARIVADFYG